MSSQSLLHNLSNNPNVPTRCLTTLEKSTDIFINILKKHSIAFQQTPPIQDIKDHIDYFITIKNKTISVDIKSNKKLMDNSPYSTDIDWIWIELKNVQGKKGWLLGKADALALIFHNKIWLIPRKQLVTFIKKYTKLEFTKNKEDARYKLYSRKDRKDVVTLINIHDMEKECNVISLS